MGEEEGIGKALAPAQGRITLLQYRDWKQRKDAEAAAVAAERSRKRREDIAAGRARMNGRELYEREPWVFDDGEYA
ncbi:zinc finger CCCH domain-containing protein 15-like [Selaginella moellendorffii]|uniref:zinc finger CCCH domain-containing protein 15-like n=1 Tax=Selaginella moellendorffii TaxID=88036 RepID=UPI000D1C55F1|nr:zinc finger CCCH domain-containing protein 15-like [Selaginella moellendorffii]|eukprot:XP_024524974.1 zinc finger CCCH domain-containing protein 15-like [Selaginella moellendorffii]